MNSFLMNQTWIEEFVETLKASNAIHDQIMNGSGMSDIGDYMAPYVEKLHKVKMISTGKTQTISISDIKQLLFFFFIDPEVKDNGGKGFPTSIKINADNRLNFATTFFGTYTLLYFDHRFFEKKFINLNEEEMKFFIQNLKFVIINIVNKNPILNILPMDDHNKSKNIYIISCLFAIIKELKLPILMKYLYDEFRSIPVDTIDYIFDNYDLEKHTFIDPPWFIMPKE